MSVRAAAVYAPSESDHALPTKEAIREVQKAPLASLGSLAASATSFTTDSGKAVMEESDWLFRICVDDRAVYGFPRMPSSCRLD